MTELMLDPADAATASRPLSLVETGRAVGGRIDAIGVGQHAGGREILHDVSLSIQPGELVALVGGSGAGKTTLLEILAGSRAPSAGQVMHDGVRVDAGAAPGSGVGYVPQDDIIHVEMPLRRTLQYAARLRLPAGTSSDQADRVVDETMCDLDLADRRDVAVRMLSGGQRKRASIAVELLTQPRTFFLDEPTSGLDPSTSAEVVRLLRRLTGRGVTVVLTTHEPATIDQCDQVVFLARNGHLAFAGTPSQARRYFGVHDLVNVYDRLASEDTPRAWAERFAAWRQPTETPVEAARLDDRQSPSVLRQWWLLTRRNAEVLVRNRLTLAILLGSPVLVTAMMAMLFRARRLRAARRGRRRPGPDRFLGRLCRLLLRPHLRAAPDRRGDGGLPARTALWTERRRLRRLQDRRAAAGAGRGDRRSPRRAARARSASRRWLGRVRVAVRHAPARGGVGAGSWPAGLGGCLQRLAGRARPADALLPPGTLRRRGCSSSPTWRLPDACSAWAWPTATRSRRLGRGLHLDQLAGTLPSVRAYGDTFSGAVAQRWLVLAGFAVVFALATVWVLRRRGLVVARGRR